MRCSKCPLFSSWNNESDKGEACAIFGEDWGNRFQYENKEATEIVGCYIDKAYIKKVEKNTDAYYENMAKGMTEFFDPF
jgi:hypothetical protein